MNSHDLLKHFLPEGILNYFELIEVKDSSKLHSNGFYPVVDIQDFPIRKKACFLEVKRVRWIDIDTREVFSRDWNLVAKGTRMTGEFALFLKRLVR